MTAAVGICIIGLTIMFVMHKLLLNLYVPPSIVPDNLFSPSSYVNVVRQIYIRYLARLSNGMDGILVDIKVVNAVFIIIVLSIAAIAYKITSLWEKHKATPLAIRGKATL
jgi:hypothetical protein